MTWLEKYNKAVSYAEQYNYEYRLDIVHDAWAYYYKLTNGLDLFEVPVAHPKAYIATVIRRAFFRFRHKERLCSWDNETPYHYFSADEIVSDFDQPDEILIGKDIYNILLQKLKQNTGQDGMRARPANMTRVEDIFRLTAAGHDQKEISEELQIGKTLVQYHSAKINKLKDEIPGGKDRRKPKLRNNRRPPRGPKGAVL